MKPNFDDFIDGFLNAVDFQNPVHVDASTRLSDLAEWDSLAALSIIVMFDIEYSTTINGNDLKNCETVLDLFEKIK